MAFSWKKQLGYIFDPVVRLYHNIFKPDEKSLTAYQLKQKSPALLKKFAEYEAALDKSTRKSRGKKSSKKVEAKAVEESGITKTQLMYYKRSFGTHEGVSPYEKRGRKLEFRGVLKSKKADVIDVRGKILKNIQVTGHNALALREYRLAVKEALEKDSQAPLTKWQNAHPSGLRDVNGKMFYPETRLSRLKAALVDMPTVEREQYEEGPYGEATLRAA